MESKLYNQQGKESGKVSLPETVFGAPWNADLLHQVVVSMQANARTPVAHAHDRSEQRGGGRKPWKQKGTGRARHGSRRSPIWRSGGVTFGPRNEKDYSKKINKKMRTKALYIALSRKLKDNEIIFIDSLSFNEPKTRSAQEIVGALSSVKGLEALGTKKKNAVFVSLPEKDENITKSFRNISKVGLGEVRNLNPLDVLSYKYLIITNPSNAFSILEAKGEVSKKEVKKEVATKKKPAAKKAIKKTTVAKKETVKKIVKKKTPAKKAPAKKTAKK